MFDTSKDILYIVLAIAVALITFFLVWSLYYVTMMLKKAHQVAQQIEQLITSVRDRITQVEGLLKKIEDKLTTSASYLPLVLKGISDLMGYFQKRKQKKAKSS